MKRALTILLGGMLFAAGCAGTTGGAGTAAPGAPAPTEKLSLPTSALPGPGECRYWFPARPDEQPKAGSCAELGNKIPSGAWYLRRPAEDPSRVYVTVTNKVGTLVRVGTVDASTGKEK